jgi:UDPglucose--hexose-1-phosphate uridylyltransferase
VANGYAALAPGSAEPDPPAIAASGCHEVIIESPRHDHDLADMDADESRAVIETYLARYRQLARDPAIAAILLFRNHGARAGSSLMHPHAQLMAVGLTPPEIERREAHAGTWYGRTGENPYLAALAAERRDGRRMVAANGHFMAFVPYAAEAWCEIRIAPVRPVADPTGLWPRETQPLADLLRDCLQRLRRHAGDPAYNLILTASSRDRRGAPWAGWYFRILPRIVPGGGFEMGTGIAILASTPEADAARLRGDVNG